MGPDPSCTRAGFEEIAVPLESVMLEGKLPFNGPAFSVDAGFEVGVDNAASGVAVSVFTDGSDDSETCLFPSTTVSDRRSWSMLAIDASQDAK